jgi:DNA invertase Pin-like site-specific DNA recombinase
VSEWIDACPRAKKWNAEAAQKALNETHRVAALQPFDRLQADIFTGKIKTVILWKLDRLSRNLRDGVNVLADWADKGLKIVVITQQLELSGVIGRTIAGLLLGLAEIEHSNIKERQRAGVEAAKARGVDTGRTRGTTKAKPGRARELKDKGLTMDEIAIALGISNRTVRRLSEVSLRQPLNEKFLIAIRSPPPGALNWMDVQ